MNTIYRVSDSRGRKSFTLMEIVAVIAIIAILFALVMYAARIARESAYCLQVRTQLQGRILKSGPKILTWTTENCIQVQWTEAATPDHPLQTGIGEFDVEQNTFVHITYTPDN